MVSGELVPQVGEDDQTARGSEMAKGVVCVCVCVCVGCMQCVSVCVCVGGVMSGMCAQVLCLGGCVSVVEVAGGGVGVEAMVEVAGVVVDWRWSSRRGSRGRLLLSLCVTSVPRGPW